MHFEGGARKVSDLLATVWTRPPEGDAKIERMARGRRISEE